LPRYAIGFANDTKQALDDVYVEWPINGEKYMTSAGVLNTGAQAANNEEPGPIPGTVTLHWKTPDGKDHSKELEVAKKVPDIDRFSGTVWFKFQGDDVIVITTGPDEPWLKLGG
jgi:hypothetical protein